LYSALREYSTYVNFAHVEAATYGFIMDKLLQDKKKEDNENNAGRLARELEERKKNDPLGGAGFVEESGKGKETTTYPINNDEKLEFYSRCFVDDFPSRTYINKPKKGVYQDTLVEKKMEHHIRGRDWKKVNELKHM